MFFAKLIASFFGIGYIQKGAGTVAALFCCVLWAVVKWPMSPWWLQALVLLLFFFIGVVASSIVEKAWGHDSNRIVIDEVHGMLVALFLLPADWQYMLAAFVLFRFFDIAKPLGIRKMENFPKGYGVMMDDLLAGAYSNVLLQIALKSHLFS